MNRENKIVKRAAKKAVMKIALRAAYKAAVNTHNLQINCLQ